MKISSTLKSGSDLPVWMCCAKQVGLGSPLPLPDADTDLSQEFATESACFVNVNLHPTLTMDYGGLH